MADEGVLGYRVAFVQDKRIFCGQTAQWRVKLS